MPRIDDRFLDCSIYLYPSEEAATSGEKSGGTGFLAAIPGFGSDWCINGECPQPDFHHCYAVTNKHVAEKCPVVRLNRERTSESIGHFSVISFAVDDWTYSDDYDIAIVPIDYAKGHRYLFIARERFLTMERMAQHDVGIGDEVFMVGRFVNREGKQVNNPSVRWGHVSMMPLDVFDDPDKAREIEKEFVVEVHSISGFSGSPVFVRPFATSKLPAHSYQAGSNTVVYALFGGFTESISDGGPWLLGVERAYIHFEDKDGVKKNTGMSGVIPAWHILDLLNTEKMLMQRRNEQETLALSGS